MFISSIKTLAYLASYLGRKKQQRRQRNQRRQNEKEEEEEEKDRKIYRFASSDYRLVYQKSTNKNFLFFTAFINLDKNDIDFQYFEEGRSGEMLATVHGNGRIEFEPKQEFELNSDGDYLLLWTQCAHQEISILTQLLLTILLLKQTV